MATRWYWHWHGAEYHEGEDGECSGSGHGGIAMYYQCSGRWIGGCQLASDIKKLPTGHRRHVAAVNPFLSSFDDSENATKNEV